MSYAKDPVPGQISGQTRSSVQHREVTAEEAGQRLDNYLRRHLKDVPRSRIYRLIRRGEVRVNGRRAGAETRLQPQDEVRIPPVRVLPPGTAPPAQAALMERIRGSIVYEDDRLIVLDKPAGIAVHGGSGVSSGVIEALRALRPQDSLELVHRLDRDTSGCLLIARHAATLRGLHKLLREDGFEKRYLALVRGRWELGTKRIDIPLRTNARVGGERTVRADPAGKPAASRFRPVQFFGRTATLVEVTLITGRTHQIRVHAAHAGHPVAGDEKYGDPDFNRELHASGLDRMFLHAASVSFTWPQGGEFSVNTPLPPALGAVLEQLTARTAGRRPARTALTEGDSPPRAARRRARSAAGR
jgi:23S rRNA pseudouridine955/2504/2580 synthase